MGGCLSAPIKAGRIISRRLHYDNRPKPFPDNSVPSQASTNFQVRNVLKNPTGNNIKEKYEFGKELGRGEFGVTYQCFDKLTNETYACKTISKAKLRTDIDVEDVRREVEIMRHFPKHPNIVSYKEAYEDHESIYLVMELCEGGELFDRIVAKGHYTERAAAMVTKTILEIVKVCHDHGVIHRDLKPENFLFADVHENSQLKAIDFGLSIFFQPGQRFSEIVGSPYYMAPEVLRRNYGPEVDVWSAGVILYILLCGVPPFWAETEEGIAHAIVGGKVDFTRDPWPRVSEDAKDLVKSMLDQNPYSRLTVQEVLVADLGRKFLFGLRSTGSVESKHVGPITGGSYLFSHMVYGPKTGQEIYDLQSKVVADNLSDEQVNGIKQMFNMMDTDNTGDLTFEELKSGLHKIGHPVPDPDVRMLMDAADIDGNGTLSIEEFVAMSIHLIKIGNDEHLTQAFRFFDKNQTGYIEFEELRDAMQHDNLGPNCEEVIKDIISDVDLDKDGRISFDEFKAMMKSGMDWKMASRQYSRAMLNALSMKLLKDKSMQLKT